MHHHHHHHHHHHGHHGHHHHHHDLEGGDTKGLWWAFLLNAGFAVIEIAGGLWTGSVAILSDAVHDMGDALALGTALMLESKARKGSDARFSYGYRRFSLLSAFLTGIFLVCGCIWVLSEAIPRLFDPSMPKVEGMIGFALLGIAVNGVAAWKVHKGSTLNEKMVSWHLIEDVLGWVAVLIGSIVMLFWKQPLIDPILSIGFTLFILWNVYKALKTTVGVFLQSVPDNFDEEAVCSKIKGVAGVMDVHDVHAWSLDGSYHILTVHVVVASEMPIKQIEAVKVEIRKALETVGKFHATIEIETECSPCEVDC